MSKINSLLVLLAVLFTVSSCHQDDNDGIFNCVKGTGAIVTQEINVSEFTGVKLEIAADIYITQADAFTVSVTGQQNIINELERDVNNGTWEVEFDRCVKNYNELTIHITMPETGYLSISGSGTIYGENTLDVNDIYLSISGSGDMILDLDATKVEAKISGSGQMKLKGETERAEYKISGSGDYSAFNLLSNVVDVKISGSGDAEVFAKDYLDVEITGSGDIYYKGNPSLDVSVTGSGRVYDSN